MYFEIIQSILKSVCIENKPLSYYGLLFHTSVQ